MFDKLSDKEWSSLVNREKRAIDRATISMWRCAQFCRMPPSHSINSFGIETIEQIKSIQWAIEHRKFSPAQLDSVKKSGKKITELVVTQDNPHKVQFITIWDI